MFTKKLLLGMLLMPLAAFANFEKITIPVDEVMVPQEYDANDQIEFAVVTKTYNSCYQLRDLEVKVDSRRRILYLNQKALLHEGKCLQAVTPFDKVVRLEHPLPPGTYQIADAHSEAILGVLPIGLPDGPQFGPDSYAYAPVRNVRVASDRISGQTVAVLSGTFENECSQIQDVWVDRGEKVTVIRPIIVRVTDPNCRSGEPIPFQFSVPIAEGTFSAPHLVHVRAQGGESANEVVALD